MIAHHEAVCLAARPSDTSLGPGPSFHTKCPMPCPALRRHSVVPVYPPEGSDIVRAGSLPGEPSPRVPESEVRPRAALLAWAVAHR